MDFIKGNEQVKIDPSGIDISGAGHIFIDSNSVTGDISFNNKVSVSDNFDVTGDIKFTGDLYDATGLFSGSKWTESGENIYRSSGSVGIGTTDPSGQLHIYSKNTGTDGTTVIADTIGSTITIESNGTKTRQSCIDFRTTDGNSNNQNNTYLASRIYSAWENDSNLWDKSYIAFKTYHSHNSDNFQDSMVIKGGNVGIGTSDPNGCMLHLFCYTQTNDNAANIKQTTGTWTANGGTFLHNYAEFTDGNQSKTIGIQYEIHENVDHSGQGPTTAMLASKTHSKMHIISNNGVQGTKIYDDTTSAYNNVMTIYSNGYVGIGTSEPTCPLRITSTTDEDTYTNAVYGYHYDTTESDGGIGNPIEPYQGSNIWYKGFVGDAYIDDFLNNGDLDISIHTNGTIWTHRKLLTSSDERIKTDISNVDDDRALIQVKALESKEYHYIDPIRRRPMKTIGFIAQEVKEVIPNAVSFHKEFIPDEMRIITEPTWTEDAGKYYLNIPNLDMSGAFTQKAKFYVSNDPSANNMVCKEVDIKEVPTSSMDDFSTTNYVAEFDQSWNKVFFYGKEVSDFHTIDKAQIFALHHSAIQELDRKHEREVTEKNNKIQNLEGEVSNLTGQISSLTSRLEALETSVLSLQNN
ncbi:MAG: tail fiber domain-containing protein [Limisphaerales bacterium]